MGFTRNRLPFKVAFSFCIDKRKEAIDEDSLFFENEKPRET